MKKKNINYEKWIDFTEEKSYIRAKKRVKAIKGFYVHLCLFCLIIFISAIIILA